MSDGYVILQNRSERTVRYKTPQGKEVCLTREVYLRDDISCQSELCPQHSQLGGCLLSKDITTFLIIDGEYALNFWEVFEFREIKGLIVTLSTANFVQQHSPSRRPYRRIRSSLDDPAHSCVMFDNEFHRQCYHSPQANESLTDYVTRMNWFAAHFYQNHLGNNVSVILVTDNSGVVSRCASKTPQVTNNRDVTVMNLPEFLLVHCSELPAAKLLFESLHASLESQNADRTNPKQLSGIGNSTGDKELFTMAPNAELGDVYAAHLPESALLAGLRSGQFLRGILRISRYRSSTEATVVLTDASQVKHQPEFKDAFSSRSEVSVHGMQARNRGTEGDVVVVRLMPRDQWQGVSGNISATENCAAETVTDAIGTANTEEQQCNLMPCGFIVGVLNRGWRDYVCTYVADKLTEGLPRNVGETAWLLVTPWDRRIPRIRIHTTQVSKLARERFIVRIDSWPAHSTYPNGHFVKSLGPIGDLETETQTILIEHGLEVTTFTDAQLKELAPYSIRRPWLPDPAEIARRRDLRSPAVSGNPSSEDFLVFSIDPQGCEDVDDALSVHWLPPFINEEDGKEHRRVQLGVHIADVTFFVPPQGYIDAEARRRSTSIYLADRRYDMLPGLLSGDICSLWSGVDRYAVSVIWEIDMELMDVIDIWYGRTVIRSAYKMTYEAAQQIHDCDVDISASHGPEQLLRRLGGVDAVTGLVSELHGITQDRLVSSLAQLKSAVDLLSLVASNIRTRRVARGGLELDSIEISVRFSDPKNRSSEQLDDLVPKEPLEMHSTIAELMIFANHWVARRCLEVYPDRSCLRRHPPPKPQHFDELQRCAATRGLPLDVSSNRSLGLTLAAADDPKDPEVKKVLLQLTTRAMTNALYFSTGADNLSREQFSHYGLALNLYTHFTSPIRRYADILVHRVLLTALGDSRSDNWSPKEGATGDLYLLTSDELSSVCQHMNEQHWSAQQVQRASMELFQALYFRNRTETDEVRLADGIICQLRGNNGFGILVSRYGIRGSVCVKDPEGKVAWAAEDGQITWKPADSGFEVTRVYSTDRDDCGRLEVRDTRGGGALQTYHVFDHVLVKVHVAESAAHGLALRLQLIARRPNKSDVSEPIPPVQRQQQITSQIVEAVHSDEAKKQLKRKLDEGGRKAETLDTATCGDENSPDVGDGEVTDKDILISQLHDHNSVYHRFAKILRSADH